MSKPKFQFSIDSLVGHSHTDVNTDVNGSVDEVNGKDNKSSDSHSIGSPVAPNQIAKDDVDSDEERHDASPSTTPALNLATSGDKPCPATNCANTVFLANVASQNHRIPYLPHGQATTSSMQAKNQTEFNFLNELAVSRLQMATGINGQSAMFSNTPLQPPMMSGFSNAQWPTQNIFELYKQSAAAMAAGFVQNPFFAGTHDSMAAAAASHQFLLHPFRKPKRIRTAFSPTQLLQLEHSFENNHYVVGAERKQLAQRLALTETQVKVWFQNRRTKHKRMKGDEPDRPRSAVSPNSNSSANSYNGNDIEEPSSIPNTDITPEAHQQL